MPTSLHVYSEEQSTLFKNLKISKNSCTAKNDLKEVSLEIRGHYDWKKVYTRYQIE